MAFSTAGANKQLGRYELLQTIAKSYIGQLWAAKATSGEGAGYPALIRHIALPANLDASAEQRIVESAWDSLEVNAANVVKVAEVIFEQQQVALALDYVEGEPLPSLVLLAGVKRIAFPVAVVVRIGLDLLAGIEAMHQAGNEVSTQHCFGGVSTDSVIVGSNGQTYLIDVFVSAAAATLQPLRMHAGKIAYSAPEQLAGEPCASSDVFAVGLILWELLAGRKYFVGTSSTIEAKLREPNPARVKMPARADRPVPARLLEVIEQATHVNPDLRFQTANEMREALTSSTSAARPEEVALYVESLAGMPLQTRRTKLGLEPERRISSQIGGTRPRSSGKPPILANEPKTVLTAPRVPAEALEEAAAKAASHSQSARDVAFDEAEPTLAEPTPRATPAGLGLSPIKVTALQTAVTMGSLAPLQGAVEKATLEAGNDPRQRPLHAAVETEPRTLATSDNGGSRNTAGTGTRTRNATTGSTSVSKDTQPAIPARVATKNASERPAANSEASSVNDEHWMDEEPTQALSMNRLWPAATTAANKPPELVEQSAPSTETRARQQTLTGIGKEAVDLKAEVQNYLEKRDAQKESSSAVAPASDARQGFWADVPVATIERTPPELDSATLAANAATTSAARNRVTVRGIPSAERPAQQPADGATQPLSELLRTALAELPSDTGEVDDEETKHQTSVAHLLQKEQATKASDSPQGLVKSFPTTPAASSPIPERHRREPRLSGDPKTQATFASDPPAASAVRSATAHWKWAAVALALVSAVLLISNLLLFTKVSKINDSTPSASAPVASAVGTRVDTIPAVSSRPAPIVPSPPPAPLEKQVPTPENVGGSAALSNAPTTAGGSSSAPTPRLKKPKARKAKNYTPDDI